MSQSPWILCPTPLDINSPKVRVVGGKSQGWKVAPHPVPIHALLDTDTQGRVSKGKTIMVSAQNELFQQRESPPAWGSPEGINIH